MFIIMLASIICIFLVSFLFMFLWFFRNEQKESREKKVRWFSVIGTAFVFALVFTVVFSIMLIALLGAANVINVLFSLKISTNQILILVIALFIYLLTVDSLIELGIEILVGKNFVYTLVLFFTRLFAFYMIGVILHVEQTANFVISAGVAFLIFIFEIYRLSNQKLDKTIS